MVDYSILSLRATMMMIGGYIAENGVFVDRGNGHLASSDRIIIAATEHGLLSYIHTALARLNVTSFMCGSIKPAPAALVIYNSPTSFLSMPSVQEELLSASQVLAGWGRGRTDQGE